MTPLPTTVAFLRALVATAVAAGAALHYVITVPRPEAVGRDAKWASWSFPVTDVETGAAAAAALDAQGRNVYAGTYMLAEPLRDNGRGWSNRRGGKADVAAMPTLALDVDIVGPGHAPGATEHPLPPDVATGMAVLRALPPPSMLNHSGGGLQAHWLLDELETDDPIKLVKDWADGTKELFRLAGWHVDTPDTARVLRVPGTHRRKSGVPVNPVILTDAAGWPAEWTEVEPWYPTVRYGAADLLEALPIPAPPEPRPARRPRVDGEVGPADACRRLSWAQILEPFGWRMVGPGMVDGTPVDLWLRPGDPSSDVSAKATDDVLMVQSTNAGFPRADGAGYSKFQALAWLGFGGDESAAARAIRLQARQMAA